MRRGSATYARFAGAVPAAGRSFMAWHLRPWRYRGSRVSCPCCSGRFRSFMSHRGAADVRCPRCGSMERHRLLWLYLERNPGLLRGSLDVLHVAPEPALKRRLAATPGLNYVTGDLDSPLADITLDVRDMPFADGSFDVVICNHVLEHVDDDRRAMGEIRRVLRPAGWALLLCPIGRDLTTTVEDASATSPSARLARFGQEDHVRLYGDDYLDRLREAGFAVESLRISDVATDELVEEHKLRRATDFFREDELIFCHRTGSDAAG